MEHEELEDAAEENGEPDQLVSHVHSASYCPFSIMHFGVFLGT